MSKLHIKINHTLTEGKAKERIKKLVTKVKSEYGDHVSDVRERWTKNTGEFGFKVMGYDIKGNIVINENTIELNGDLPWQAALFKGKIEAVIKEQAKKLLKK